MFTESINTHRSLAVLNRGVPGSAHPSSVLQEDMLFYLFIYLFLLGQAFAFSQINLSAPIKLWIHNLKSESILPLQPRTDTDTDTSNRAGVLSSPGFESFSRTDAKGGMARSDCSRVSEGSLKIDERH